ncbi:MAG: hypothetical protein HQM07_01920 [Zetaproteobacteria bacterium]|nr:hypothetical protein [Zetaproteobacteria bacterium]
MEKCSQCDADVEVGKRLCEHCRMMMLKKTEATWKRQIRFYTVLMVIGVVILSFAVPEMRSSSGEPSRELYVVSAMGGLCLMGGFFGLALALFFSLWHGKSKN